MRLRFSTPRDAVSQFVLWTFKQQLTVLRNEDVVEIQIFTARIRRMGEGNVLTRVCPSVCPQGGGGIRSSCWGGGQIQLPGGGVVRSSCRGGSGPAAGGGGQVQLPGGGVRSSYRLGGQVQQGGLGQSAGGGGVSILRPLAGGMPLAFTQEDFLVSMFH